MAEDKRNKGFAGLQSLLPDVDAELKQARDSSAQAELAEQNKDVQKSLPRSESELSPGDQTSSANPSSGPKASMFGPGAGLVATVVLGLIVGLVWLGKSGENKSLPTTSAAQRPSWESAPLAAPSQNAAPAPQPSAAPKSRLVPLEQLDPSRAAQPPTVSSRPPAPPPPRPVQRGLPTEELPPVGRGLLLSTNQIRYCFFEKARLDAMDNVVDKYSALEVDGYNEMVGDYNSRCGSFRYHRGALEPVRAEVEVHRSTLEAQARRRFSRWRGSLPESGSIVGNLRPIVLA